MDTNDAAHNIITGAQVFDCAMVQYIIRHLIPIND